MLGKRLLLAIGTLLAVLPLGCGQPRPVPMVKDIADRPNATVKRVDFLADSFERLKLRFALEIHNPNKEGILLAGYRVRLAVETAVLFDRVGEERFVIPGQSSCEYLLPIDVPISEVRPVAAGKKSLSYHLSGDLRFQGETATALDLPIGFSGTFPLLSPPDMELEQLIVRDASVKEGVKLHLRVNIFNPNEIAISIPDGRFTLTIDRVEVAECRIAEQNIPANEKQIVEIPLVLSSASIARAVILATAEKEMRYTLSGSWSIRLGEGQSFEHRFRHEGKIRQN